MAELDIFEARFAAACRRSLDEARTEVDAAEVARAVVALPRPRTLPWATTFRAVPALAWLLLLALLIAALGACLLVAGSRPGPVAFACPPGSTPDATGPVGQARPPISGVAPTAFDRSTGRIVLLVNGSAGTETWTFDVCTNTWAQMHPSREPHRFGQLVYDASADLTITVDAGARVWAYDLGADTWTEKGHVPAAVSGSFYDPVAGRSSAIRYGGSWTTNYDAAYSGGSAKSSSSTRSWATLSFTGRAMGVVMTRDQLYGQVRVYLDGLLEKTVDTHAAGRADRVLVYAKTWSRSATHHVSVEVVGTHTRPRVDLDAFVRF